MADVGRPMWRVVLDDITAGITDGRWPVGQTIPSYSALAEQYGVSIGTVQKAIGQLRDQGVLRGEQGVAVVVAREPQPESAPVTIEELARRVADQSGVIEDLTRQVLELEQRVRGLEQRGTVKGPTRTGG